MTDWKTWPKCGFLTVFFFLFCFVLFCFVLFFSEQLTCQIWVVHSFEIWNLILDEQDTRQNTELKKSVVQSVSLCVSYLFLYILTSKFIEHWKKKLSKKNSNLEFCWIKRAPKNKCARQLWDIGFIFLALSTASTEKKIWRNSPAAIFSLRSTQQNSLCINLN